MHFWHNLSPANKSLFIIAFSLHFQNKVFNMDKSLRLGAFIPTKLFHNHLASLSLRNINVLLLHTSHFDKSIILLFLLSVFHLHCKQGYNIVLYSLDFYLSQFFLVYYLRKRIHRD